MINDNKGLDCPKTHLCGLDVYVEMICSDVSLDVYFEMIFSDLNLDVYVKMMNSPVRVYNETERWLFDSNSENYEKCLKIVLSKAPHSPRFSLPVHDVECYFHSFLTEQLIDKNQLKKEIDKGKKIKTSVIYEWFLQYSQRTKFKEGGDALCRTQGARTQAEVQKIKSYENGETEKPYSPTHHLKNMGESGFQVASVVSRTDSETGLSVGEPDYFVNDDFTTSFEEKSENDYMRTLLLNRFGESKVDMYYSLWLEMRYEQYSSKRAWARARKISYTVLNNQIEVVQDVFRDNLESFGY